MNQEALLAAAVNILQRHGGCYWETDTPCAGALRFGRRQDSGGAVTLRVLGDEVFELILDEDFHNTGFAYDDPDKVEVLEELLSRGLAYLDGQCTLVEKLRGGTLLSHSIRFPDGYSVGGKVPIRQRARALLSRGGRTQRVTPLP